MRSIPALVFAAAALAGCRETPSNLAPDPDAGRPAASSASASPSAEGDVSQRLQKVLSLAYPDATVARGSDPKHMVVRWPDGRTAAVMIENVERDCAATPNDCDAVMRRYARAAGITPKGDAGADAGPKK